ncbi:alkylmercury lyase [Amycolatopsis sp. NPDC051903]|uniref:alkylmercury lyase n=1 Tax=Amycolatopsis sp. NPDC051903 TaxID=3363936 RepID=UPI0037B4BF2E
MKLEILQVRDCRNAALLDRRLDEALAGADHEIVLRVHRTIETIEDASATGMTGSPTLLVDGVDPFREPGVMPSVSCRLYVNPEGHTQGGPAVETLCRVLGLAQPDGDL